MEIKYKQFFKVLSYICTQIIQTFPDNTALNSQKPTVRPENSPVPRTSGSRSACTTKYPRMPFLLLSEIKYQVDFQIPVFTARTRQDVFLSLRPEMICIRKLGANGSDAMQK